MYFAMEPRAISQRELRRYAKQIMLPGIGVDGQERILRASVLVVGAGGLGCPVLQYLTAAGVGRIGIVEFDMVNEANLQRQILYGTADVGKLKSVIAGKRLEELALNNGIEVINIKLDSRNAPGLISKYDIIVDATDNFDARYVISDCCLSAGKPMVHGSIYMYEGCVSVFCYKGGPGYRHFNPGNADAGKLDPAPSDVGLFGMLPGITGTLMANEVVKIITGNGKVLSGELLIFNILDNTYRTIKI